MLCLSAQLAGIWVENQSLDFNRRTIAPASTVFYAEHICKAEQFFRQPGGLVPGEKKITQPYYAAYLTDHLCPAGDAEIYAAAAYVKRSIPRFAPASSKRGANLGAACNRAALPATPAELADSYFNFLGFRIVSYGSPSSKSRTSGAFQQNIIIFCAASQLFHGFSGLWQAIFRFLGVTFGARTDYNY